MIGLLFVGGCLSCCEFGWVLGRWFGIVLLIWYFCSGCCKGLRLPFGCFAADWLLDDLLPLFGFAGWGWCCVLVWVVCLWMLGLMCYCGCL